MEETITAAQMRALEQAAFDRGEVTGLALMERAGRRAADAILNHWPGLTHALILCGPGNNGGDGYVIARHLHTRGLTVSLHDMAAGRPLPQDAEANRSAWAALGAIYPYNDRALVEALNKVASEGVTHWVIIDALFGIGQRAPLDDALAPLNALIDASTELGEAPAPLIAAVDVPTGYDADSGEALAQRPVAADLCVTFHRKKPLHVLPAMADMITVVADIGLDETTEAE